MSRAIFHIGYAKTATTYLQHCLHLNEALFLAHDYWIPSRFAPFGGRDLEAASRNGETISGNLAPAHVLTTDGPGDSLPAMATYLFTPPKPGCDIILSSELFFHYPTQLAVLLRAARDHGHEPEILAWLPNQDRAAIANYLQYVRNHDFAGNVIDFLEHDTFMGYCRYLRALDLITDATPNLKITLRTFNPRFLAQGDIFADFLAATSCTVPQSRCSTPRQASNQGLSLEHYELLREAAQLGRPDAAHRLRTETAPLTPDQRARIHAFFYRPKLRNFLLKHYIPDNTELLRRYHPNATPDETTYWQHAAPVAPAVTLDQKLLQKIRAKAFA